MKHLQKCILLPKDIHTEIRYRKITEGFNFSKWVASEYHKQFGSTEDSYAIKIKKIEKRVEECKEVIL